MFPPMLTLGAILAGTASLGADNYQCILLLLQGMYGDSTAADIAPRRRDFEPMDYPA